MKVLTFGGSGFIGKHIIEELLLKGHRVLNYDIVKCTDAKIRLNDSYEFCEGNILNKQAIYNACTSRNFYPEVIYNLAAISNIKECNEDSEKALQYNIIGNLNALFYATHYKAKFIYTSSVYVHNNESGIYGITKSASEKLVKYYAKKHNFPYVILRYGTVYGQGAGEGNSIRDIIEKALKKKVISYYGSKENVREYIHVKDVAKCSVDMIDKKFNNSSMIISGINPIKAEDMILMIKEILGNEYIINFGDGESVEGHYKIIPYKYENDIAKKYIADSYYDFGAGLLSVIEELNKEKGE